MHFEIVRFEFILCIEGILARFAGEAGVNFTVMFLPICPIIKGGPTLLTDKFLFSHIMSPFSGKKKHRFTGVFFNEGFPMMLPFIKGMAEKRFWVLDPMALMASA
jgi:hypothetical protein